MAVLVIGLALGAYGALYPTSAPSTQSFTLLSTNLRIAANDYQSQNLILTKGQAVNVNVQITNKTIFNLLIMNQSQYYNYYGCAPACHQPLLGGNGSYYQQAGEKTPYFVNSSVSPSAPYTASFAAPTDGTYYFVFDNTVGGSWSQYINGTGGVTAGSVTLTGTKATTSYSVNWTFLGVGAVLLVVGGAVGSAKRTTRPAGQ